MYNPYKFFNLNLHPMMDDDGGGLGGPAPQETESGSVADGVSGTDAGTGGAINTDGSSTVTDPPSQTTHNPENNPKFAEMRVKVKEAERRAAEAEAARQRDISIAKKYGAEYGIFSEADIAEKWGSQGIKSLSDFESALRYQEAEEVAKQIGITPELLSKVLTPEILNKAIESHPLFQQIEQAQLEAKLNAAFSELSSEYPEFKTMDDVYKLPTFERIVELISRGNSLLESYELANRAEIRKQQAEAARQATLNSVSGKGHLRGNGQGSEIDTTVIPDEVLEMYKKFNPGKTLEEYKKHYKQSLS